MRPPLIREAAKLGVGPGFRFLAARFDEAPILQRVQGRVEGTARHLDDFAGNLLEPPRGGIAHRLGFYLFVPLG